MRILQINTERSWRGGERQTLYALHGLLEAGVEVGLLCREGSPLHEMAAGSGAEIHPVFGSAHALARLAQLGGRYDLLHPQSGKAHSLAILSKAMHRRPVLYTRRVNFVQRGLFNRWKYRHTDRTVAISRAIEQTLEGQGVRGVVRISSAVRKRELNREFVREFAEREGLEGWRIVATTGDLVPQKDPETMVRTMGRLLRERDDTLFLHFGATQMGAQVRRWIAEEGIEERYRLLGHVDGVEHLFDLFDVFLVTGNETEGLCSSVYDAFVYGVPVVATRGGGLVDSVGERGLSCAVRDADCLAEQLRRLLDDPDLGQQLAGEARSWAAREVSVPAITARYLPLYEELVRARPRA